MNTKQSKNFIKPLCLCWLLEFAWKIICSWSAPGVLNPMWGRPHGTSPRYPTGAWGSLRELTIELSRDPKRETSIDDKTFH